VWFIPTTPPSGSAPDPELRWGLGVEAGVRICIPSMKVRDELRSSAFHLLRPGEQMQVVSRLRQMTPYAGPFIGAGLTLSSNCSRVVVVTDRRILLCHTARIRTTQVNEVGLDLPRNTIIRPAHGIWYQTDGLAESIYIHRRYHKDVAAADSAIGASHP
jgi:hypothetical protein